MTQPAGRERVGFYALVTLFVAYATAFIWRTSFEIDGVRHFCLMDDAMISMRYAKHLAEGYGLVWNRGGPRVEGFSDGLWVLVMAVFHRLGLAPRLVALPVQMLCGVFLLLNLLVVRRVASLADSSSLTSLAAVALTAFYLPLNNWALQGLEVGVLAVLLNVAVVLASGDLTERRLAAAFGCLGVAVLVRIDMVIPAIALGTALSWRRPEWRRRALKWLCLSVAVTVALQTIFRLWYFHAWLPNTYYLKLTGTPLWLRWSRGALAAVEFIRGANWVLFVAALVHGLRSPGMVRPAAAVVVLAQIAYSVYVGGDVWELWGGANRFIAVTMPLYFVLLATLLSEVITFITPFLSRRAVAVIPALTVFVLMIDVNLIHGSRAMSEWLLVKRPLMVSENAKKVALAEALTRVTDEQATIAVVWAGSIPYFAERPSMDLLGKNDPVIARQAGHERWTGLGRLGQFVPGHNKWDYSYSIGQLRPDVVAGLWDEPDAALRVMGRDYVRILFDGFDALYFRRDSSRIAWTKLAADPWMKVP